MPRWIMKFEVEAHLGVRDDLSSMAYRHPTLGYEVHFKNGDMKPGKETPLMYAFIIFDAPDIDVAPETGGQYLRDFLDVLGFATGVRYRTHRRIGIYDWTPGVKSREGRIYTSISDPNKPLLILDETFAPTVETFLRVAVSEPICRALRWFRVAVSADEPDIQFQWFWFVIETVAEFSRDKTKVPDRCSRCREPLYCPKCEEIPTHRPYQSQAIEQLFKNHVSDDAARAFREASAMRHALLHGGNTEEVEAEYNTTLADLVDRVGRVAWVALLSVLTREDKHQDKPTQLHFTQPSKFTHYALQAVANVSIGLTKEDDLTIDDFPNPTFDLIVE